MNTNPYSLSELCRMIEGALSTELPETYWVKAEITEMSVRGGHCYMELAEKNEGGILAAKMRATCWSNLYTMLAAYFLEETGSPLQPGMQILVETEVQYHAVYGMSLNILNIDPQYTLGGLAQQRQKTIAQLQKEGVFDLQRAFVLPDLCTHIAVISSEHAAGYQDFADQLQRSGYRFIPALFPAVMQGENAPQSIMAALRSIAEDERPWDAVVIIRGGGAVTDLNCFDDYNLCSHCAQFPLPILSGIGHTKDVSVLDMVVYLSLKTPTAVAAYLIEQAQMQTARIDELRRRLRQTAERQILIRRHRMELLWQKVQMFSPERIYRQGYSLLCVNGKVVRSIAEVKTGDQVTTYLSDGSVQSQVTHIQP